MHKQFANKKAFLTAENETLKNNVQNLEDKYNLNNKMIDELKGNTITTENSYRVTEKSLELKLRENSELLLNMKNEVSNEHNKFLEMKSS
jgi:hypothetical protein